jgi:hypothetical protein
MKATRNALVLALVLATGGASPLGSQIAQPEAFVVRHAKLAIALDYQTHSIAGSMTLDLENWTKSPASRVSLLLNRLMEATGVSDASGAPLRFTQDVVRFQDEPMRQVTRAIVDLGRAIEPGARASVRVDYVGNLVGYTEIGWLYVKDHVDTAFTIIRADALAFPEIGGVNDAANRERPSPEFTYEASVRVPARYVVATGGSVSRTVNADGTTTWNYRSQGASPFLNIAIAPFDTLVDNGVRVFYFPSDSLGARRLMRATQSALALLTQWFGALHSRPSLTVTEIPDDWGSQAHLVGGIIQTAAAFRDSGHLGELYHELSHLWNARDLDNPSPRWNEGLAMFIEYLLQERVDNWPKRAEVAQRILDRVKKFAATDSAARRVPFIEYGSAKMTGWSYSVGDLMFATLYDLVGQDEFNKIVGGYYQRFAAGGTTRDFIDFAKRTSTRNLTRFFDDWLITTRWTSVVADAKTPADLVERYRSG